LEGRGRKKKGERGEKKAIVNWGGFKRRQGAFQGCEKKGDLSKD